MPNHQPDKRELVESVREMMQQQLLPSLQDQNLVYQCRVSINILCIVERELAQGAEMALQEQRRLAVLLDREDTLENLNSSLIKKIRQGVFDDKDQQLLEHLKTTALAQIAIDNPRYSTYKDYLRTGELSYY